MDLDGTKEPKDGHGNVLNTPERHKLEEDHGMTNRNFKHQNTKLTQNFKRSDTGNIFEKKMKKTGVMRLQSDNTIDRERQNESFKVVDVKSGNAIYNRMYHSTNCLVYYGILIWLTIGVTIFSIIAYFRKIDESVTILVVGSFLGLMMIEFLVKFYLLVSYINNKNKLRAVNTSLEIYVIFSI